MKLYSEEELKAYLTEHLKYERHMLGFAYKKLFDSKEETWCAMFECFGIHTRILHDFLRNEGKSNTIKAVHYVNNYKVPNHSKVNGKMNISFFHLSTSRLENDPVNINDAVEISKWIDKEWETWAAQLPDQFKRLIEASPVCTSPSSLAVTNIRSTATNVTIDSTSFTNRLDSNAPTLSILKPPPIP